MRKRPLSKAAQDAIVRYGAAENAASRPGLPEVEGAAGHDNARMLEWLAEHPLGTEWTAKPLARDGLALAIIALFERHYRNTGNPAFVWAARQTARDFLPYIRKDHPGVLWIDVYIDLITERMVGLIGTPPKEDVNNRIAEALGFDLNPGRGKPSALSKARRLIRDVRLAGEVLERLPHVDGREKRAVEYVMKRNGLRETSVWNAFRRFRSEIN